MSNETEKKREYVKVLSIAILVSVVNSIFASSMLIGYSLVVVEIGILLYCLVCRQYFKYLCYYVVFLAPCMEFETFVGDETFYNLKNIRVMGINLAIYMLLPIIAIGVINILRDKKLKRECPRLWDMGIWLIGINLVAVVVGLISILVNDNDITGMESYFGHYIGEAYELTFLPIGFFVANFLAIKFDKKNIDYLSISLQATLMGLACQVIFPPLLGVFGEYGGTTGLLCSTAVVFVPIMVLLYFERGIYFQNVSLLTAVIAILFLLRYGASGKTILTIGIVCIILLYRLFDEKKRKYICLGIGMLVLGTLSFLFMWKGFTSNVLFNSKMQQVQALLDFRPGWLERLPVSPKVRVGEYINIATEYAKKPWYIITGKGFLGTIKDYSGLFMDKYISVDAFSDHEWANGTFYGMHELAGFLLTYGVLGVVFAFKMVKIGLKEFKESTWVIFAVYWLLLYYGYSMTLSALGLMTFYFSLYKIDMKNEIKAIEGEKTLCNDAL